MRHLCACALAALATVAAPAAQAQVQECSLNGEHINLNHGGMTRGKSGLVRCVDKATGVVMREETLQDGRTIGLQRWYTRGKLTSEHSVNERGNRDGLAREWNGQGVLVSEGSYANGAEVGLHRRWHDDGTLKSIAIFDGDRASARNEARARMEFTRSGRLSSLRCADRPLLERDAGPCGHQGSAVTELFHEAGGVESRVTYERGKRLREDTFWTDGKPRSSVVLSGERPSAREYSREGVLKSERVVVARNELIDRTFGDRETLVGERRTVDGRVRSETQWYLNGQKKLTTQQEDAATQAEQRFHDNGKLSFEGRYKTAERGGWSRTPIGVHKAYDASGQLRREVHFDDKGVRRRERSWSEAGQLEKDDELYEDGSRKR